MRSAAEAVAYAKALHALVRWIGICDGNMQEGSFRCDANVSVRRPGAAARHAPRDQEPQLASASCSRRSNTRSLADRDARGRRHDRAGDRAVRSGHGRNALDAHQGRRARLPLLPRSRPAAAGDHRRDWIERVRGEMPELPDARCARFDRAMGLSPYDAAMLAAAREIADYFEGACAAPNERAGLSPTG